MKTNRFGHLTLIFLLSLSFDVYSQENQIGLEIGYGNTIMNTYNTTKLFLLDEENSNFYKIGLTYSHSPKYAIFNLKSGISYDYKKIYESHLNYFRIPIGLDFQFGNKMQVIFGGGIFTSYLFSYNEISNEYYFEDSKRNFQIGWYGNFGLGINIYQKYNFSFKYQYNHDLTKLYEEQLTSPGGSPYTLDGKGYDGFLILSINYILKNK